MKDIFPGYYSPSDDELSQLWSNCIFVLDANVLLNLYRYPDDARNDLLAILETISDRLWIPHQVALEYQMNRLQVISEQRNRYREVRRIIGDSQKKLTGQLDSLQLKKRHSKLDPDELLEKLDAIIAPYLAEVMEMETSQQDITDEDVLRMRIDRLFDDKVGPAPESQEELDKIYAEGKIRYQNQRPPGYLDSPKGEQQEDTTYYVGDVRYEREYGDLILWHQLIDQAKSDDRFKNLIFVTDDRKADWWWIVDSAGKKTIGPRPELVDELRVKADVDQFYMYNPERFMLFSKEFLDVDVKEDSIAKVGDFSNLWSRNALVHLGSPEFGATILEGLFLQWLNERYPNDVIESSELDYGADLVRTSTSNGARIGYELKSLRDWRGIKRFLRDIANRNTSVIEQARLDGLVIVLVTWDFEPFNKEEAESMLSDLSLNKLPELEFLVGSILIDEDARTAKFVPIAWRP